MKMEIYKLQVTQYNDDGKSDYSAPSQSNTKPSPMMSTQEHPHPASGFELPHQIESTPSMRSPPSSGHLSDSPYQPSQTKKSLVSVGKSVLDSQSTRSYHPSHSQRPERNKEKQKILDKLEELERIQKFNE